MQIFRLYAKVVSMIEGNKQTSLVEVILDENSRPQPLHISDIALEVASDFQTYVESKAFGGSSPKQYVGPTGYIYCKEDGELREESLKGDTKFRFKTPPPGVEDEYKKIGTWIGVQMKMVQEFVRFAKKLVFSEKGGRQRRLYFTDIIYTKKSWIRMVLNRLQQNKQLNKVSEEVIYTHNSE